MTTWHRIKRFFRGIDVAMMRSEVDKTAILDDYDQVFSNIGTLQDRILTTSNHRRMPPPPYEAWDDDRKDEFDDWAKKNPPPKIDTVEQDRIRPFARLSELLTGFSGLDADPVLAAAHLARLEAKPELRPVVDRMIHLHSTMDPEAFVSEILEGNDPDYPAAARTIILLWYTGAFFDDFGFPADFGTPEDTQYTDGLVWQAISAHPMGYSTEGAHYWSEANGPPRSSGRFTGLGDTAERPGQPPTPADAGGGRSR